MQFLSIDLQLKFKHHQHRIGQISNRIDFPVIFAYGHLLDIYIQLEFLDQLSFPIKYSSPINTSCVNDWMMTSSCSFLVEQENKSASKQVARNTCFLIFIFSCPYLSFIFK